MHRLAPWYDASQQHLLTASRERQQDQRQRSFSAESDGEKILDDFSFEEEDDVSLF